MQTPRLDLPDAPTVARRLTATLEGIAEPVLAMMDGALFDDLPGELLRAGITARSLFLDHADPDVERAGPWLVPLATAAARSHVEAMAAAQPCAVFWACPEGDMALWRHLRKLNRALIPLEPGADPEGDEPPQDGARPEEAEPGYEAVLFRHWDPNVLGAVLPLLDAPQFARVFGPATSIVMYAQDHGGLLHAPRPEDLPPPPPGMLKLRPEQMDGLREAMTHSSRLRIARFLKGHVPGHFEGVDDEFLWGATLASEGTADELGVRTERGRARWAYVMMLSDGRAAETPEVRAFVRNGGRGRPDDRVRELIGHTAQALRASERRGMA